VNVATLQGFAFECYLTTSKDISIVEAHAKHCPAMAKMLPGIKSLPWMTYKKVKRRRGKPVSQESWTKNEVGGFTFPMSKAEKDNISADWLVIAEPTSFQEWLMEIKAMERLRQLPTYGLKLSCIH